MGLEQEIRVLFNNFGQIWTSSDIPGHAQLKVLI